MTSDGPTGEPGRHFAALVGADDGPAAIPAATVILVRDTDSGAQVLMVRRDASLSFAGGMWVFPGGRVDPTDFADRPDDLGAAERRAAARESFEEAGLRVAPDSLVRFSHWTPPPQSTKRFTTAFFVTSAPAGRVVIDDGEIRDHHWATATEVLDGPTGGRRHAGAADVHHPHPDLDPPVQRRDTPRGRSWSRRALLDPGRHGRRPGGRAVPRRCGI